MAQFPSSEPSAQSTFPSHTLLTGMHAEPLQGNCDAKQNPKIKTEMLVS